MTDATDAALAKRVRPLIDLTDLSDACGPRAIDALCARARGGPMPVAAVCVWPRFVAQAKRLLQDSSVSVATVANFPAGGEDPAAAAEEARASVGDGADEVDVVIPYRALADGYESSAAELLAAVRRASEGALLKVILETGELVEHHRVEAACRVALEAGADFLKTSTGKSPVSATPEAAEIMLLAIRAHGGPVGLKPSGGIRTLADAARYLDLADRIMGPDWASRKTFRFGASGLLDAVDAAA